MDLRSRIRTHLSNQLNTAKFVSSLRSHLMMISFGIDMPSPALRINIFVCICIVKSSLTIYFLVSVLYGCIRKHGDWRRIAHGFVRDTNSMNLSIDDKIWILIRNECEGFLHFEQSNYSPMVGVNSPTITKRKQRHFPVQQILCCQRRWTQLSWQKCQMFWRPLSFGNKYALIVFAISVRSLIQLHCKDQITVKKRFQSRFIYRSASQQS